MELSVAPNTAAGAWLGLENAAVLIAGAGGIGRALIEGFAGVGARVVAVDNDAARVSSAVEELDLEGRGGAGLVADLRDPDKILADRRVRETLDLSQPIALPLFGVLHFIPDEDDPYGIVARLTGALPAGSYLAVQHPTRDFYHEDVGTDRSYRSAGIAFQYRSKDEFVRFLDGLELVPPGIQLMTQWRADDEPQPRPTASEVGAYGAVARKP